MDIVTVTTEPAIPARPYRLGRQLAALTGIIGWLTAIIAGCVAIGLLVQHGLGILLAVPWLLGGLVLVLFGEVSNAVFDVAERVCARKFQARPGGRRSTHQADALQ